MWAELDPTQGHEQSGRRPIVVLSQDVFNERSGTVIACALTSREPRAVTARIRARDRAFGRGLGRRRRRIIRMTSEVAP